MSTPPRVSPEGRAMALFLFFTGIGHFLFPKALDGIVPSFMPGSPRMWTYLSGIAELTIAGGLLVPSRFRCAGKPVSLLAAWSALILYIAVFPANINMAILWADRAAPAPQIAYGRLPLQLGLFYWAWTLIKKFQKT